MSIAAPAVGHEHERHSCQYDGGEQRSDELPSSRRRLRPPPKRRPDSHAANASTTDDAAPSNYAPAVGNADAMRSPRDRALIRFAVRYPVSPKGVAGARTVRPDVPNRCLHITQTVQDGRIEANVPRRTSH